MTSSEKGAALQLTVVYEDTHYLLSVGSRVTLKSHLSSVITATTFNRK